MGTGNTVSAWINPMLKSVWGLVKSRVILVGTAHCMSPLKYNSLKGFFFFLRKDYISSVFHLIPGAHQTNNLLKCPGDIY